ncbi:hypothetical protein BC828DRAFT_347980 [Blastocladiella britannica]|nr:hypothetical protein BC828DRAFT_347980 [Blastocladiella britannica]
MIAHTLLLTTTIIALALLASAPVADAHMAMSHPAPRQYKTNPGAGGQIDYSYTAPLGAYPCKGYPAQKPTLTVAAGSSISVSFDGSAVHGGGHCQFALSYDNDKTFVVVDTVIRECLRSGGGYTTQVTIPATAPSGPATFAWSWINAIGNREYYMNCADIQVTGGSGPSGSLTGPQLLVADLPGSALTFPEFASASSPDMSEAFAKRPVVTVSGAGGTSMASVPAPDAPAVPAAPAPEAPAAPVPEAPAVPNVPAAPATTAAPVAPEQQDTPIAAADPSNTNNGNKRKHKKVADPTITSSAVPAVVTAAPSASGCVQFTVRCVGTAPTSYDQCINNAWITRALPPNWTCSMLGA